MISLALLDLEVNSSKIGAFIKQNGTSEMLTHLSLLGGKYVIKSLCFLKKKKK